MILDIIAILVAAVALGILVALIFYVIQLIINECWNGTTNKIAKFVHQTEPSI